MSNPDERVVRMEFDNGEFEKNAKETMSTLDKLKEALNFENTEQSFEQITNAANKVDVSHIASGVDTIQAKFSTMQVVAYSAINNITNRMMNFAHGIVSGMWASTVQGGINRAFKVEKAKFNIQGLGKDWEKISKDISDAVKGTAYGFDEAAAAAASLTASDIVSTGNPENSPMARSLKAIAGAAAMTGSSFSDISNIFTTVAGNGRLLSQQLNQFSSRALNAAAVLRDYVNKHEDVRKKLIDAGLKSTKAKEIKEFANEVKLTEGNIRSLVSGSVIDFQTFSDAMSDAFGNQAKKADKTFNGVLANVKAALARIGQAFAQPLIANNDMDTMLQYVNTPLRRSMNIAKDFWNETSDARHKFFKDLRKSEVFAGKSNSELRKEWAKNPKEFEKLLHTIKGHENDLPGYVANMVNTQRQVFVGEMKNTKEYANFSTKELNKIYDTYHSLQNNLVGVLQGVKKVFLAIESSVTNSKALKIFLSTTQKGCQILILSFNTLAAALNGLMSKDFKKFAKIEIFGNRQKAHVLTYGRLLHNLRKALGMTKKDFDNLKDTIKGVIDIFKTAWYVVSELFKAFIPAKSSFKGMGSSILEVTGFLGRMLTTFSNFIRNSGIVIAAANTIRTVVSLLITPIRLVTNFVGSLFKIIRKGGNPLEKITTTFKGFYSTVKNIASLIKDRVGAIFGAFFEPFIDGASKLKNKVTILDPVFTFLSNTIKKIGNVVKTGGVNFTKFVDSFNLIEKARNAGQKFYSFIMGGFVPGIKTAFEWCKKFISGSFGKIGKAIKDIWDKVKGLKIFDFTKIFSGGDKIASGANGFGEALKNAFSNFSIKDAILTKLDEIRNIDFSQFIEGFKEGVTNFIDFLGEARDKIAEAISNLKKALEDKQIDFKSFGDRLKKGLETSFKVVLDLGPMIIGGIALLFAKMIETIKKGLPKPNELGVFLGDFIAAIIENLVKLIPWAVETIGFTIRTIASHLPDILKSLAVQLREALDRALFEPLVVGTGEYQREIPPLFNLVSDALKAALGRLGEELKDYTLDDFVNLLKKIFTIDLIKNISGLFKARTGLVKDFGKLLEDVLMGFEKTYKKYLDDQGKAEKFKAFGEMIRNLAISIGILAVALIVLGTIPQKTLEKGAEALYKLIAAVVIMSGAIAAIDKTLASGKLDKISEGMSHMIAALTALAAVVVVMSFVNQEKLSGALGILALLMTELGAFVYAIKKIEADADSMIKIGTAIAEISGAIGGLVAACVFLGMMPHKQLEQGLKALGLMLVALIGTVAIIKRFIGEAGTIKLSQLISVLPIIIMLGSIILALWAIKKLELDPSQLKWIDATLIVLAGIILAFDKLKLSPGVIKAAAIGAAAIAVFVDILILDVIAIAAAIGGLSKIPGIKDLIESGGELLKAIGKMFSQVIVGFAEGVSEALTKINTIPVNEEQAEKVSKVADVLMKLAQVQAVLEQNGGLLAFFAGDQPFKKFGSGVVNLFDQFKDVGKAAGKITNIDKIESVTEIAAALSKMVATLKDPKALGELLTISGENKLTKFGKDLIDFAEYALKATDKFKDIDTSGMQETAKEIASSVKSITKALPSGKLKSTGSDAVDDIKSGVKGGGKEIASQLGKELTSAVDSISTDKFKSKGEFFIKAFIAGMENQRKDIKKKAKSLAGAAANAIDDESVKKDATTAGENVLNGFKNGLNKESLKTEIARICRTIGKSAIENLKKGANEASPSKDADLAGRFIDIGFINGMTKLAGNVAATAKNLGSSAVSSLKLAMDDAAGLVTSNISEPTIRPVMDLSNVKMGVNSISSMFNRNRYALGIAGSLDSRGINSARSITLNTNLTVNGAEDPTKWADEFAQELEIQARTV